jgi:ketosteroid isomerase-like protein
MMRRKIRSSNRLAWLSVIAVGVAMFLSLAGARAAKAQGGAASKQQLTEAQVLDLQKRFQDACVAGNVDAIGPMMTDDAIFIHGNGAMQGKTEFLAAIKNGQLSLSAYDLKEPKVILFDGGAIVSGLEDLAFKPPAGSAASPRVIHMRGSAVWVRKAAGWRLLLDQDTTLAAPPVPAATTPSR